MGDIARGSVPSPEQRLLHEANAEAAIFYQQELLRTTSSWPAEVLGDWGVEAVLKCRSSWQVGYAPEGGTRAIDHLQKKGFGRETLMRAGLMSWTDDGRVVDRYQDQLVVVSRDQRLDPVGFVGVSRDGKAQAITPETPVHRPSEALVGVREQIDALEAGATAVLVDHPLDAIGIQLAQQYSGRNRWVGIPLVEASPTGAQARILRQYSRTSRVIVTVMPDPSGAELAAQNALDLTAVFDNVQVFQRGPGPLLISPRPFELIADLRVAQQTDGPEGSGHHFYMPSTDDPDLGL
ncbi:hypothetical protein [Kribbella sp. CA-293567]|uniref:hypothetical protein n=1 Tax=Kribbella sp. CA-293567 TaxID=3002436 RepID=UPI0022DDFCC3|nr:hypothetical protein [Kribbella sp. CA-293567]WBQ04411.1 hypothetical protein OX958_31165 [Kribbella sp. CA-293567]